MSDENKRGMGFSPQVSDKKKQGINYLLSIALEKYAYLPSSTNSVKDAHSLVQILLEKYQFPKEFTHELYNEEATKINIVNAFKNLVNKVNPNDNLLIFFSGHGAYDETFKEGYWMPYQAKEDDLAMAIPNSLIKTMLSAVNCHHLFVMVDSCLTGVLFNRGAGKLVQRLEKDPSRWALTSGRNSIFRESSEGKNNEFTTTILNVLNTNVGPLGVAELCRKVVETLPEIEHQLPIGEPLNVSGHRGGQFVFQPMRNEILDWKTATSQGTMIAFEKFLAVHPEGKYAATARHQIFKFKASEKWQWIQNLPAESVEEINEKLEEINLFIKGFEHADEYNEALTVGEHLEYKREFLVAKTSFFKLRIFAQKVTPYQKEAQALVATHGKEEAVVVKPPITTPISVPNTIESKPIQDQKQEQVAIKTEIQNEEPTYEMSEVPNIPNNAKKKQLVWGLLLFSFLGFAATGIYQQFFKVEALPIKLVADAANGKMIIPLKEGLPPYDITIVRNEKVEKEIRQPTKGEVDLSQYFQMPGDYEFKVEDAEERVFSEKVEVKEDEAYPPYLVPKVNDEILKVAIRKGKPPYTLQLGEGELKLTKTYQKNGTKTIDLTPFRENGGRFELMVKDGNNKTARRFITIEPAPKQGVAMMLFEKENHDFGTIIDGETPEYTFKFRNNGTETLFINKIRPSSRSIQAKIDKKEIYPGEQGELTVSFNSKGRLGNQIKKVIVTTNAEQTKTELKVMAEVIKEPEPEPEPEPRSVVIAPIAIPPPVQKYGKMELEKMSIDFGSIASGQMPTKKYYLKNTGEAVLEIKNMSTSCSCISVEIENHKVGPGSQTNILITLDAKHLIGDQNHTVTFEADSKPETIDLKIIGNVIETPASGLPFMVDLRNGKKYKTAKLKDNKVWMIENLQHETSNSSCYANRNANCQKFGRLYKWADAKKACPEGWHLPTYLEWEVMRKFYGGYKRGGKKAYKALGPKGESNFNAQLSGYRYSSGSYMDANISGNYWTSTKEGRIVYYFNFDSNSGKLTLKESDENFLHASCRCVKD